MRPSLRAELTMKRLFLLACVAALTGCANSLPEKLGVALTDGVNNSWSNTEQFLERSLNRVQQGASAFDNAAPERLREYCDKDGGIHVHRADPALARHNPVHFVAAPRRVAKHPDTPYLAGRVNGQWELWQQQRVFKADGVSFRRTESRLTHYRSGQLVARAVNYVAADRQGQFGSSMQCADLTLAGFVKVASTQD